MEPAGFAIGVACLAGAFTSCIECFEYVQLGRKFGEDYGKCVLRLDAAKVRMSRWGASVGLGAEPRTQQQISASEEEFRLARSLLEQIIDTFEDAEKLSGRFKKHAIMQKTKTEDLIVYDAKSDLDTKYQWLHLTMRELVTKRQHETSLLKKTTWALYEKKRFDTMIDDVTGFVNELVELFPAAQDNQRALCKAEVSAIKETQDLALLKDTVRGDDELLEAAVKKELENRGHTVTNWKAGGNVKLWAGDDNAFGVESKSHHFSEFSVSDFADVRLGNVNRGKGSESYPGP
jgi:Prion-inhibition and propagation